MDALYDISRLPDKEIKKMLGEDEQIKIKDLVVFKNTELRNVLYKVIHRNKDTLIMESVTKGERQIRHENIQHLTRFNYNTYKEILNNKYTNPGISSGILSTSKKLAKYLRKTLYRLYGEGRVEVYDSRRQVEVTVYFSNIVVQNSLGMTHKLRDVYITLTFFEGSLSGWKLSNYKVARGTYTAQEVASNYVFSHANENPGYIVSSFCFESTAFGKYLIEKNKRINPLDIPFLIEQFRSFLEWESIEGVPYRRISNIAPFKMFSKDYPHLSSEEINTIYSELINKLDSFKYDLSSIYAVEAIVDKKDIESTLLEIVPDKCKIKQYGDKKGIPVAITSENTKLSYVQKFTFKGRSVSPTVIEEEGSLTQEELEANCTEAVFSEIVDLFQEKLSKEFTEFLIKYKLEND